MSIVDEFFQPWETKIASFESINAAIADLYDRWVVPHNRLFAWRGVVSASWPLHSSLYRRLLWTRGPIDERDLSREERQILKRVHQWGLHHGQTGRLSILAQLATLQHFGAPTRLVDVTLNAYIGLWFAVEKRHDNGALVHEESDGRLFAIDVTRRLINEDSERRPWEDDLHRPWKDFSTDMWSSNTWAWKPAPFQARIASQHGAFLVGGVPRKGLDLEWPKDAGLNAEPWRIDDVRRCTSLPLRFHEVEPAALEAEEEGQPAFTFRIAASAKQEIRERLKTVFGYSYETIYPDYPGFAEFGTPELRSRPA